MTDIKSLIKLPLAIAIVVIVVRLILEQTGAPDSLIAVFGVTWLHLLVPFYLAIRIAKSGAGKPFLTLLASLAVFTLAARILVAATYSLAYALSWEASRFQLAGGGVVGEEVTPLEGYLLIPLQNLVIAGAAVIAIGMILGSITLAILRRRAPATGTA